MFTFFEPPGTVDTLGVNWRVGELGEANGLLRDNHYLGPLYSGAALTVVGTVDGEPVAAMLWKHPTSRRLPSDGSWLELARWCLTPDAGPDAGSRMHKHAVRLIRDRLPAVTTLVSYSDPGQGHTGALYRACNWQWAPTWVRLRPPPSGHGDWGTGRQGVKDRWVFAVRRDPARDAVLHVDDLAAVRFWQRHATEVEIRWALRSPNLSEHVQGLDVRPLPLDATHVDQAALGQLRNGDLGAVDGNMPARADGEQLRRVGTVPGDVHASERSEVAS